MPRSQDQNQQRREESRARLLDSAMTLFAQHGYSETSVKMIAQHAGVSQGLLYNYFDGKEGLLVALFEQSMAQVRASFAAADDPADARPPIEKLIRASFAILRDNLRFWQLSYSVRNQVAVIAGLGEQLHGWSEAIRRTLEGYFQATGAAQPEIEAAILFAVIDGISQHYALDPARYPLDAVEDALVRRYADRS